MTIKELQQFFTDVTVRLRIHGWKLRFKFKSSGGYCWKRSKIIDIGLKNKNIKELILHEVAHIETCRFCNQKHNFTFWNTFDDLRKKFLPGQPESDNSKLHRQYATKGIYSTVYEN